MTQKEYDSLKEGDKVILQVQGHLKGQKAIVKGCNYSGIVVVYLEEKKYHVVYHYHKLKKA